MRIFHPILKRSDALLLVLSTVFSGYSCINNSSKKYKKETPKIYFLAKVTNIPATPGPEIIFPSHVKLVYRKYPTEHNLETDAKQERQIIL